MENASAETDILILGTATPWTKGIIKRRVGEIAQFISASGGEVHSQRAMPFYQKICFCNLHCGRFSVHPGKELALGTRRMCSILCFQMVDFLKSGARLIPNKVNVGFIKFATNVTFAEWLPTGWSTRDFQQSVPTEFDAGYTNTPAALEKANEMFDVSRTVDKLKGKAILGGRQPRQSGSFDYRRSPCAERGDR